MIDSRLQRQFLIMVLSALTTMIVFAAIGAAAQSWF
jgi:hypothetical protein